MIMDLGAYYTEVYKNHLLPPLVQALQQHKRNSSASIDDRCRAIKRIADGSLALTARGADWSAALEESLRQDKISAILPSTTTTTTTIASSTRAVRRPSSSLLRIARKFAARASFARKFKAKNRSNWSALSRRRRRNASIRSRVRELQRIIPGGDQMKKCSVLLSETADYMMFLKFQVGVLQSLTSALDQNCDNSGAAAAAAAGR